MTDSFSAESCMRMAHEWSYQARGLSSPNPPVGAIIINDGKVVGRGFTSAVGGPHAEINALSEAGALAAGATAYVTLEPCSHHGRTGPCTDALIEAGVTDVVYAVNDPNHRAAGGATRLREAGVNVTGGVLESDVRSGALREWLFAQRHRRPMLSAKIASTIDGRVAASDGTSQWITGPAARAHAHKVRGEVDAIVVGTGTALADNPSLTARGEDGRILARQPQRIVMGHRNVPAHYALHDSNATTTYLRTTDPGSLLAHTAELIHVLLEGGPTLISSFLEKDLVDRIYWYQAPKILGAGTPAVSIPTITTLMQSLDFELGGTERVGSDVIHVLYRGRP